MKSIKVNLMYCMLVLGLIFQGCAKDENVLTGTDNIVIGGANALASGNRPDGNGGGGGGPGGGSGGNGNDSNVDLVDNDIVHQWTELMLELERHAAGMRPNASARALAYIYMASYETAVPGMRPYESNERRLDEFRIRDNERPNRIHWELALNACFADVIDHFLINVPEEYDSRIAILENNLQSELSNGDLSNRLVEESIEWGEYVAREVIRYSQTDEAAEAQILEPQPTSYEPPTADGYWTYSADPERALFPYWGTTRTFVISPDQTTTVTPIAYSEDEDSDYYAQMKEVYEVNNTAKAEDNDDLWIAEFWSDDVEGLMMSPPARQYAIANQLIQQYELNLEETLVLYLKLGFALNDAAVSTWKYKYDHMVMRPNVFIHEHMDPDFQTNLFRLVYWPNPSFPGYPSGHSCFASAAGGVFIDAFGNATNFTDRTHEGRTEFRGAPRTFNSFEEMAAENAFSRIPLGVHIRMDCDEGLRLGYEISDAINDMDLRRDPL